jgi:murein DD-endopeptidase MepM/ murein hydrolase activator NlpD
VPKIHVRWLDIRSGRPREIGFSPLWLIVPVLLVVIMGWILLTILRSSQSPERLREKTDDLRRSNRQLEQHLDMIETHQQTVRSMLETLEEGQVDDTLLAKSPELPEVRVDLESILDGNGVDSLLARARSLREAMDKATVDFERHSAEMIGLPTIHPVNRSWPIVEVFGPQVDLFTGQKWLQQGVAYATPPGTPVWATGAGIVVDAGNLPRWGTIVEINHGNGFHTIYGHLQSISVKIGQNVLRGQVLGISGSSGRVTAPRTFYSVFYRRKALDPAKVLLPPPRTQPAFLDSALFRIANAPRKPHRDTTVKPHP